MKTDIRTAQRFADEAAEWQSVSDKLSDLADTLLKDPTDVDLDTRGLETLYKAVNLTYIAADARRMDARRMAKKFIAKEGL